MTQDRMGNKTEHSREQGRTLQEGSRVVHTMAQAVGWGPQWVLSGAEGA